MIAGMYPVGGSLASYDVLLAARAVSIRTASRDKDVGWSLESERHAASGVRRDTCAVFAGTKQRLLTIAAN